VVTGLLISLGMALIIGSGFLLGRRAAVLQAGRGQA
jgi:hypothetical protein